MKKRSYRPHVQSLECRLLLYGPPPTMPAPRPSVQLIRSSELIGGANTIGVAAPSGYLLARVTYSTPQAIASQTWTTTSAGPPVRTSGADHVKAVNQTFDQFVWYWDEHPGGRDVTVTTTYTTGASFTDTDWFDVNAPTATMVATAAQPILGPNPISASTGFGLWANASFGATFDAMDETGARAGFIQLVNLQETRKWSTHSSTTTYPAGLFVNDVSAMNPSVWYNDYSELLKTDSPTPIGSLAATRTSPAARDAPGIGLSAVLGMTSVSFTYTFQTFLVYRPAGGICVTLAEFDWTVSGSAKWIGGAITTANYQVAANWIVTASITQSLRQNVYKLLTWTNCREFADKLYRTTT